MSGAVVAIIALAVVLIAGVLLVLHQRNSKVQIDTAYYRSQWHAITTALKPDQPASFQLAILNADKLLDKALRERSYRGGTMGERMRSAQKTWTNANEVWAAHKVRNKIAHETNVDITYKIARTCLHGFERALKDLGAL